MKNRVLNPVKLGLLMASSLLVCGVANATTYTAVATGNWSSSATWGGTAPPFTLGATDEVIVPLTITVTMDQNVTINGVGAQVSVLGTLSALPNIMLNDISGTITGAGSINAAMIMLGSGGGLTFTGAITADTIINSLATLTTTAQITFYNELDLSGLLTVATTGVLTAGANSNITLSGGSIATSGTGLLDLTAKYSVNYITTSTMAGLELSGLGLETVTIAVPAADTVGLTSNALMTDSLKFISGTLKLNGFNLNTSSQITGAVAIAGNKLSNLTINTTGGLSNALNFVTGFQNLNNLSINVGAGNSVKIASNLTVNGILMISGNSIFDISGEALTVAGNVIDTGTFAVNAISKLAFTGIAPVISNISLSGINLGKLTVALGTLNTVKLGTNLNVDTLDLMSGTLVLKGNNLMVNGDITAGGTGVILSTAKSDVNITTAQAVTGKLTFSALNDSINNMMVAILNAGSVKLGSNMIIDGALNFVTGYVDLDSNNLQMAKKALITHATNTAYVITSGGGNLIMNANLSKIDTFQVGTPTNYLPATIALNSTSDTGTIGVSASSGVYSHGTTGVLISATQPMVNATWLFQNNIGTGINANMALSWSAASEVNGFVNTGYSYISHYASMWDDIGDSMIAVVTGSMFTVARANITSMSPFAVFNQNTIPTAVNTVVNSTGNFEIYPNPTSESLNVKNTTGSTGIVNAEIYNMLGQVVSTLQFNDAAITIPVGNLSAGTYLIRFYNDNMSVVEKFSKM